MRGHMSLLRIYECLLGGDTEPHITHDERDVTKNLNFPKKSIGNNVRHKSAMNI